MDRLKWKNDIIYKLGILLGPVKRIAENPEAYNNQEEARILAQFCAEYPQLIQEFREFCRSQPGESYDIQYTRFSEALSWFKTALARESLSLSEAIERHFPKARAAVEAVPVPLVSEILDANTPFSTYCKLRELCEADVSESLVLVDPFLDASIFHRYLETISNDIFVTLVTSQPHENSTRDKRRFESFLDISRLFAQERSSAYRLAVHPPKTLHDRWLVLDGKRIYSLGSSVKSVGDSKYYTVASLNSSHENLEKIRKQIENGDEFFGTATREHL